MLSLHFSSYCEGVFDADCVLVLILKADMKLEEFLAIL